MKSIATYEAVAQAADQIVSRHESPTIRMVRLMIGSGSFGTIAKHLETWRQNTRESAAQATGWEISTELRTVLAQEMARHVRQRVADHETVIQKLVGDREDILAENERLERQLEALTARIEEMRTEEIRREERVMLLLAQLEEERKKGAELTTRLHEAEKTIVRLEVRIESAEKAKDQKPATAKKTSPSRRRSARPAESPVLTKPAKFMTLEHEAPQAPDQETLREATKKEARSR